MLQCMFTVLAVYAAVIVVFGYTLKPETLEG